MEARINARFSLGLILAIIGGIGISVGPAVGIAELGRLGSLLADFVFGLVTGAGVGLALCALLRQRKNGMKPIRRLNNSRTEQGPPRRPSLRRAAGGETR